MCGASSRPAAVCGLKIKCSSVTWTRPGDLKGAESSECIRNKVYSIKPNTSVTLTLTKSEVTF